MADNLREQLRAIIAEVGELDDAGRITDDALLIDDLGLDSMLTLEIVIEVERRFDIAVPEERLQEVRSLGDMVRLAAELGLTTE